MNKWLKSVKQSTQSNGRVEVQKELVLEWIKGDILSPNLMAFKKTVAELASQELAKVEADFLRAHPEAVTQEMFLMPCTELLKKGSDWSLIEERICSTIRHFFHINPMIFGKEMVKPLLDDVFFGASIKRNGQLCGFILFSVTPALPEGDVKVINLVMKSSERGKGLENQLLGLISDLIPETKRVFLLARPTDEVLLSVCESMGFSKDETPFQDPVHRVNPSYWTAVERLHFSSSLA